MMFLLFAKVVLMNPSELLYPNICILFLLFVGAPILIFVSMIYFSSILLERFLGKRNIARTFSKYLFWILVSIGCLLISTAYLLTLYRISSAKRYLEKVMPFLDRYKADQGTFPLSIENVLIPEDNVPYLIRNHFGFSACTIPHVAPSASRWYCALDNGNKFELSFGYEGGDDERPSYSLESTGRFWECSGVGCLTDHR